MSKATINRLFIGSVIGIIAGAVLMVIAAGLAFANDVFVLRGSDVVGVRGSTLAWALLGLGVVGGLTIFGSFITGIVAWIGALLNTAQLESKTWFIVLLVLGLFNLGFFAMIAYVLAGPDGSTAALRPGAPTPARSPAGA